MLLLKASGHWRRRKLFLGGLNLRGYGMSYNVALRD